MTIFQIFIIASGIVFLLQLIAIGCWLIQIRKRLERIHAVLYLNLSDEDAAYYAERVAGKNQARSFDEIARDSGLISDKWFEWDDR